MTIKRSRLIMGLIGLVRCYEGSGGGGEGGERREGEIGIERKTV